MAGRLCFDKLSMSGPMDMCFDELSMSGLAGMYFDKLGMSGPMGMGPACMGLGHGTSRAPSRHPAPLILSLSKDAIHTDPSHG
jgi:hypothetical protein